MPEFRQIFFQGKSDPFLLRAYTLKSAERQVDPEAARDPTKRSEHHRVIPVLWIVFGITGLLTLIAIIILIVIRPRCSGGSGRSGTSVYGSSDGRGRKNQNNKNGLKIDLVINNVSHTECFTDLDKIYFKFKLKPIFDNAPVASKMMHISKVVKSDL